MKPMMRAARVVLEDCRSALASIQDRVSGSDWRWRWVAVVALLRAVGHVLHKVDGPTSPSMQAAIQTAFQRWKGDGMFRDFIEHERNNVLKAYRLGAGQSVTVYAALSAMSIWAGTAPSDSPPPQRRPPSYRYPMTQAPFEGQDQRTVVADAIKWWERELDLIDAAVDEPRQTVPPRSPRS